MKRKSVCMLRPDSEKVGSGKERGILPLSIGMLSSGTTCGHTALLKLPPLSHSEADSGLLSWVNREVRPAGLQPAKQSAKGRGGDATYRGRKAEKVLNQILPPHSKTISYQPKTKRTGNT